MSLNKSFEDSSMNISVEPCGLTSELASPRQREDSPHRQGLWEEQAKQVLGCGNPCNLDGLHLDATGELDDPLKRAAASRRLRGEAAEESLVL